MSLTQQDVDYSPSMWTKRYPHQEMMIQFEKLSETVAEEAQKTTKNELNVPYGKGERAKYDIYGVDLPADAPILVYLHGGYWQLGNRNMGGFVVPAFVENGIKVIVVGYDICPQVRIGDIVSQVRNVTEKILKDALNSRCRGVWVAGHSAGAHLAAGLIADRSWTDKMTEQGCFHLLKGLVLISGIYYIKPLMTTMYNEALRLTDAEAEAYSFRMLENKGEPYRGLKVIAVVGESDSPVFINESREYARKAVTLVDDVQYILLRENIDHFNIVEQLVNTDYTLTKLLLNNISGCK